MFSQILGINNMGIAVGYYGDSTTSQHDFLYNTNAGQYTLWTILPSSSVMLAWKSRKSLA